MTGQYVPVQPQMTMDPTTGQVVQQSQVMIDPTTGQMIQTPTQQTQVVLDPNTGRLLLCYYHPHVCLSVS